MTLCLLVLKMDNNRVLSPSLSANYDEVVRGSPPGWIIRIDTIQWVLRIQQVATFSSCMLLFFQNTQKCVLWFMCVFVLSFITFLLTGIMHLMFAFVIALSPPITRLQIITALEEDPTAQKMQLGYRLQQIAAAVENKVTDLWQRTAPTRATANRVCREEGRGATDVRPAGWTETQESDKAFPFQEEGVEWRSRVFFGRNGEDQKFLLVLTEDPSETSVQTLEARQHMDTEPIWTKTPAVTALTLWIDTWREKTCHLISTQRSSYSSCSQLIWSEDWFQCFPSESILFSGTSYALCASRCCMVRSHFFLSRVCVHLCVCMCVSPYCPGCQRTPRIVTIRVPRTKFYWLLYFRCWQHSRHVSLNVVCLWNWHQLVFSPFFLKPIPES